MTRTRARVGHWAAVLVAVTLIAAWLPAETAAQEICGNGTTFTVNLPSLADGGDDDSITLPAGCRIYALLVSGYSRNDKLDELTFYRLAKFVAENDGYVHWAWWNNLLKPYLEGPLHANDTLTNPVKNEVYRVTPGGLTGIHLAGFFPASHLFSLVPKAVPEEDRQFQVDAKILLRCIREENPAAIVIVAGHSMGGNAVARLGANTPVDIDLLAPIDPVGNRSNPIGRPTPEDLRADRTSTGRGGGPGGSLQVSSSRTAYETCLVHVRTSEPCCARSIDARREASCFQRRHRSLGRSHRCCAQGP